MTEAPALPSLERRGHRPSVPGRTRPRPLIVWNSESAHLVTPRVLGRAVGLSPLLVLVPVFAVGTLFGGFAVLLAIPIAAVLATLVDLAVRGRDPAEEDVPTVLFPAQETELT